MKNENEKEKEIDPELQKILDSVTNDKENTETNNEAPKMPQGSEMVIRPLVMAIQGITKVISEHTGLQSVKLTDEDVDTLSDALKPLASWIVQFMDLLIYMPLIVFAIGYTLRILDEITEKKKSRKSQNGIDIKREKIPEDKVEEQK